MNRRELTQSFVRDVMADDYENWDKIVEEVSQSGACCGVTIPLDLIAIALRDVIELGLAKAYRVMEFNRFEELSGMPPSDEIEDCYYYLTQAGKALQLAPDDNWPFNDDGSVREGWVAPAD